ncbi:hypothetical protein KEM48_010641 [Puccinia striiformis f. sp. tritici PST-130]|nr:hypothetical protein KEM48_010641 [Puccinia striiformis f. sp. tritici PST-130]
MFLRSSSALLYIHLFNWGITSLLAANPNEQIIFESQGHPSSVNLSLGTAQEGTGVLSKWARESRSQFFSDITQNRAREWIIVMGNEAGDTDSMAAAIAWAYHLSHMIHNPQKAIALLQTAEDALDLRPENHLALEKSQMSSRHRDLLTAYQTIRAIPSACRHCLSEPQRPAPGWRRASLLSIIDHHVDQKLNLSADPRILQEAASCSSLVAELMLESESRGEHQVVTGEKHGIPTDLVDLLLRAIFLDSDGLSSKRHYGVDKRAAYGLFRISQWYAPPEEFGMYNWEKNAVRKPSTNFDANFGRDLGHYTSLDDSQRHKWEKRELRKLATNFWAEMSEARGQLQQLDVRDLLRRDWKVNAVRTTTIRYPYLTLGFASIPCSIQKQVERTPEQTVPEWFAIERAFTSEIGADVSVVLTKFKSEITGKAEREIMLAIEDKFDGLQEWTRSDNKPLLPRRKGCFGIFLTLLRELDIPTDENVKYEAGVNGSDASICSWTIGCKSPTDITDAPAGMMGISFDDGPEPASSQLMKFLKSVNQTATHFMIGSRIQQSPGDFAVALNQGGHIAVHTWSHPLMTTLNDTAVLGEIGWTLQIIFDLSGGRLPAFWRPPCNRIDYVGPKGDVDNRVRAIAKNVFGLQTVIWNQDTNDWCLTPQNTNTCGAEGPSNQAALDVEMSRFVKMPKNPGLIILEHELTTHSVHGFTHAWPSIKQAGWDTRPIPSLFNMSWYQPIQLNSLLDASEVVASARARLAASSDKTSTNPPLNSTVLASSAKKPPQVGGSTPGASYRGSTFQLSR